MKVPSSTAEFLGICAICCISATGLTKPVSSANPRQILFVSVLSMFLPQYLGLCLSKPHQLCLQQCLQIINRSHRLPFSSQDQANHPPPSILDDYTALPTASPSATWALKHQKKKRDQIGHSAQRTTSDCLSHPKAKAQVPFMAGSSPGGCSSPTSISCGLLGAAGTSHKASFLFLRGLCHSFSLCLRDAWPVPALPPMASSCCLGASPDFLQLVEACSFPSLPPSQ